MPEHQLLLDAFADARRTWDDVVTLQPDIVAGSGHLRRADLIELEQRVDAHRAALDALAEALNTESVEGGDETGSAGTSNRI